MKLAIVDKNQKTLNMLSEQICSHYFPEEDVFVYKFTNNEEFLEKLLEKFKFRIVFIDNDSSDALTLKLIQELLPGTITIVITNRIKLANTCKQRILLKPYDPLQVYEILFDALKDATIKPGRIKVYHESREAYLKLEHIYYFESHYGKIYAYTKNSQYLAQNSQLYYYENILVHYGFVSIHKSLLINMSKIKFANKDEYILYNDTVLKPSARKRATAYQTYSRYLENITKHPLL